MGFDPGKNERNIRERGLAFPTAALIFLSDTLEWDDRRFDYGERRIKCIGMVDGICLAVITTWRLDPLDGPFRWIISARRANRKERRAYEAHFHL
ncbi:BrnT family toxin [Aerophototrophica crusticola]|uniref:BrnT family toxin n=1 Tax=Aerophototrophica crusticola TaxID=1709002 RepID=A0A858RBP8_9PROT|nr:BrnT family toxin [Rhodospirillaceae bacterium B3]